MMNVYRCLMETPLDESMKQVRAGLLNKGLEIYFIKMYEIVNTARISIRIFILVILLVFTSMKAHVIAQDSLSNQAHLIAHRGGVVDGSHAENSFAAIKEAIKIGYWMIEIDLRRSKDGRVLLHHDRTFERYYNDNRLVSEMTWSEISQLKSEIDGSRPVLLEEAGELAKEKIKFMLDIKGDQFPDSFYQKIEQILKKNDLLSSTYILGGSQAKNYFKGKSYLSIGYEELLETIQSGNRIRPKYYLFELGSKLNKEKVRKANKFHVKVVAAINKFRYKQAGEDAWLEAQKDIDRLRDIGINYFQIDSIYESLFNE